MLHVFPILFKTYARQPGRLKKERLAEEPILSERETKPGKTRMLELSLTVRAGALEGSDWCSRDKQSVPNGNNHFRCERGSEI